MVKLWITFGMTQINYNAPWHQLKHTWVGATYGPEFYEPIQDHRVRDSLQKIAMETEEDYQNLITLLHKLGVSTSRPKMDVNQNIMDFVNLEGRITCGNSHSYTLIPRPPMQPRDSILIVGQELLCTLEESHVFYPQSERTPLDFDAPMVTVIGRHLIVDCRDYVWLPSFLQKRFPDRKVVPVNIGGHNDAVFCPVRPGLIISSYHHDNYQETYPGWEVKYIENQSWNAIPQWRQYKHANASKWWVPDSDNSKEFATFVDTWLNNWLGYVEETVFDVNMLQIDERTVLVNNYNKDMFDFFKSKHIEPIIATFRHRFFWDGGIHCITGDTYREGVVDDYITVRY